MQQNYFESPATTEVYGYQKLQLDVIGHLFWAIKKITKALKNLPPLLLRVNYNAYFCIYTSQSSWIKSEMFPSSLFWYLLFSFALGITHQSLRIKSLLWLTPLVILALHMMYFQCTESPVSVCWLWTRYKVFLITSFGRDKSFLYLLVVSVGTATLKLSWLYSLFTGSW